ncbi:heat shock 70 kDa protein 14 [Teleopsis dalmanni]|uniref:heat shock 70 kDa protein 14 n=1 Tax=Teleopsis dalmanni TaxID=139649 RepID=UPI0018CE8E9D|nr:heat shock 70 kDa protein 14 [Teleopsis dalmanni]
MWPRFGVKVGNSTLCIAHVKADGKAEVIANKQGDRVSQACLLWDGEKEIECGLTAKQKMASRPKQGVANSFQMLLPEDSLKEKLETCAKDIPCEYDSTIHKFILRSKIPGEDDEKENTKQLNVFDIHMHLFKAELELARQFHSDIEQKPIVVLSIPSYYPDKARELLAQSAEDAGFHVAQIISEPSAALLAYSIGETDISSESKYILAVKSGGLFSHIALYQVRNGFYTQLDSYGPFPIGGKQFSEALVQFICEEFQRKYKLDPHESRRSIAKIRNAAMNCKHILTTLPSTQIYIDSLMDGIDYSSQMSRARFESLIQPVISTFMQTLSECVEKSINEHSNIKINAIVLLGATMQIPKLQSAIAALFPDAMLYNTLSTDEVVALGCARQATFLVDADEQELDITENSHFAEDRITIWHNDEADAKILIEKGTMLPNATKIDIQVGKDIENITLKWRLGENEVNETSVIKPTDEGLLQFEADTYYNDESKSSVIMLNCL